MNALAWSGFSDMNRVFMVMTTCWDAFSGMTSETGPITTATPMFSAVTVKGSSDWATSIALLAIPFGIRGQSTSLEGYVLGLQANGGKRFAQEEVINASALIAEGDPQTFKILVASHLPLSQRSFLTSHTT